MLRRKFLSLMLVGMIGITTVFSTGCGFISDLKVAIASSGPLISLLVSKGVISQEKASFLKQDFSDAVDVTAQLERDFKAATGVPDKLVAAQKAQRAWQAIYERGHFGINPAIQSAASIIDSIFATIVAYYGGTASANASVKVKSDKELAVYVKAQTRALKEVLRVK